MNPPITIRPFQPENQVETQALILAGLADHWGELDPTLNSDLNDISASYADAVFLVAWHEERIVGTGALAPRDAGTAEIVRMSVADDMRRAGIGTQVLCALIDHAKASGYRKLILETTETWVEVIAFYERFGFKITHYQDGDVYFALEL